jgi:hypothetical protein
MAETKCKRGFQSHVMCDCEPVHPLTAPASGSGDHAGLIEKLHSPHKPLSCGARVFIVTEGKIEATLDQDTEPPSEVDQGCLLEDQ